MARLEGLCEKNARRKKRSSLAIQRGTIESGYDDADPEKRPGESLARSREAEGTGRSQARSGHIPS